MIPNTIAPSRAAWVRLPAPQTRQFVSREVLRLIRSSDLGRLSESVFRFQAPSDCIRNSRQMREALVNGLLEQGQLSAPGPGQDSWGQIVRGWLGLPRQPETKGLVSGEQLMQLNQRHGPLVLTLQGAVQPGQGDDRYTRHHSVVLIASFEADTTRVGILLDGNDLQRNPAIDRIAQWLASQESDIDLSQLTPQDLERINAAPSREPEGGDHSATEPDTDVLQAAFRLVDLDSLVAQAEQRFLQQTQFALADAAHSERPNLVQADTSLSATSPVMPPEVLAELRQAIGQDPQLIERFPEPEL